MKRCGPISGKALRMSPSGRRGFRVCSFRIIRRIAGVERVELVAIGLRGRVYEETVRILPYRFSSLTLGSDPARNSGFLYSGSG